MEIKRKLAVFVYNADYLQFKAFHGWDLLSSNGIDKRQYSQIRIIKDSEFSNDEIFFEDKMEKLKEEAQSKGWIVSEITLYN